MAAGELFGGHLRVHLGAGGTRSADDWMRSGLVFGMVAFRESGSGLCGSMRAFEDGATDSGEFDVLLRRIGAVEQGDEGLHALEHCAPSN